MSKNEKSILHKVCSLYLHTKKCRKTHQKHIFECRISSSFWAVNTLFRNMHSFHHNMYICKECSCQKRENQFYTNFVPCLCIPKNVVRHMKSIYLSVEFLPLSGLLTHYSGICTHFIRICTYVKSIHVKKRKINFTQSLLLVFAYQKMS